MRAPLHYAERTCSVAVNNDGAMRVVDVTIVMTHHHPMHHRLHNMVMSMHNDDLGDGRSRREARNQSYPDYNFPEHVFLA